MSTEREATPPARIWIDWRERDALRGAGSYYFNGREGFSTEYIRADSFDTMRDALREIARGITVEEEPSDANVIRRFRSIASSALAAIDGKDS